MVLAIKDLLKQRSCSRVQSTDITSSYSERKTQCAQSSLIAAEEDRGPIGTMSHGAHAHTHTLSAASSR